MNCVNFTSVRPHLERPQAARLAQSLRDHFWPGLRVVVGRQGHGKTDLLRQAYLLQCKDLAGPIPVWLRPGSVPEGEQFVTQVVDFRAGRLHSPFATLDPALLATQRDQALLMQVIESSGNNSPARFFGAVERFLGGGKDVHVCIYLDDAPDAWLHEAAQMFGLPIAVLASAVATDAVPRDAELIRLEELSTREAVLLGETLARAGGLTYRGGSAEGFCAHLERNPQAIAAAVLAATHAGRSLETETEFADALLDASDSQVESTDRALQHATLLAAFAQARRREEQTRVNARISAGLARLTPACETWLTDQGVAAARVPVVTSAAFEDLPGGTLHLAFGSGVFGGQEMLAVALLEADAGAGAGNYGAAMTQFRNRIATLAPPPATLFDPRWEHVETWAVFQKPPADAAALAESAGARLVAWDVFERLVVGQASLETFPDMPETVLRLPLDKDFEIPAVYALDHLLERRGVDKRSATQIRMALVEACVNAIEHGRAASAEDAFMEVRLQIGREQARITVSNPGLLKSELGASLLRGHGRKILRSLMDSVRYESDLNRTRVVLTKRIPGPAAEADHEQASTGGQRS